MNGGMIWLDPAAYPEFLRSAVSAFSDVSGIRPCMAVFRKKFVLDSAGDLLLRFTGSGKCRIFINGKFVEDGPCELGGDWDKQTAPDWRYVSEHDCRDFCCAGENVIAAEVLTLPEAQTDYSSGFPGFQCEILLNGKPVLQTDRTWKGFRNPAYCTAGLYDETLSPGDYLAAAFDDSAFPFAADSSDPNTVPLQDLHLQPLFRKDVFPCRTHIQCRELQSNLFAASPSELEIEPGPPVSALLEFPEEVCGHLAFEIESEGRAELTFEMMENPSLVHRTQHYIAAAGTHVFRFSHMDVCQFLRVTVQTGSFHSADYAGVKLRKIRMISCGYPVGETVPFDSDDPELKEIRDCCDRTLRLCLQRLHLDSPVHQEGLGCQADYRIQSLMEYALYGTTDLTQADLRRTAEHIRQTDGRIFHTSFSLIFISWLREYLMYSGDFQLVRELFPAVETVLARFAEYTGPEGLISEAPNYLFIDWIIDGAQNYHHPCASRGTGAMTAFCIKALDDAADLAERLGLPAAEYRSRSEAMRQAFQQLWDPDREAYCDGIPFMTRMAPSVWLPADEPERTFSTQTNALAVAFRIVPEAQGDDLLEKVLFDKMLIPHQMYFMHYLFDAIHARNKFDDFGFDQLKRWLVPVREHPSSLKEAWNTGDYCHAWGGTPAWQVIRGIFGIEILEPGCKKLKITPANAGPENFSGIFRTPQGSVSLKKENGRVQITLPSGIEQA